jgi:hypothetical protein
MVSSASNVFVVQNASCSCSRGPSVTGWSFANAAKSGKTVSSALRIQPLLQDRQNFRDTTANVFARLTVALILSFRNGGSRGYATGAPALR